MKAYTRRTRRYWLPAVLAGAAVAAAPATAAADTQSFYYTGSPQVFQVPPGVTSIQVHAFGGIGGDSNALAGGYAYGGTGADVTANVAVSAGELFDVWVGSAGQTANLSDGTAGGAAGSTSGAPGAGGAGGAGNGTAGGGGGGGASELTDLGGDMIVAAGGGGGAGGSGANGVGFNGGTAGNPPQGGGGGLLGGHGGTSVEPDGTAGGDAGDSGSGGGGGGGGGYPNGGTGGVGGTGSGPGGGGGAGSSYVGSGVYADTIGTGQATSAGDGRVDITWTPATPVTVTLKAAKATLAQGTAEGFTATVKPPAGDPLPTGTVTFMDNGQTLGTASLSKSSPATAKLTTTALPHGPNSVYAVYNDDLNYQMGYSGAVSVTVYERTVSLSPAPLAFGARTVGSSTLESVTVTNSGLDPVSISSAATGAGAFSLSPANSDCVGATLNPGQTCTIAVLFSPTKTGSFTGSLTVKDNATPGTQAVKLTGAAH